MSIRVEHVSHIYMAGTPFEAVALDDVSVNIDDGEFVGLIGETGSGKSTLVQHFNGLLKPTRGKVYIDDIDLSSRDTKMKEIRRKVGLVFQYPEHQLFEETVYGDVAFGPRNLGLSEDEVAGRVMWALRIAGLDYEGVKDRSPFELSGGQMRRVAIAGVLAMQPKTLILDEPAAGLDPRGRDDILGQIKRLHTELGMTIVLVSHNMEDVAELVDRLIVMNRGKIAIDGPTREVFKRAEELREMGLGIPQVTELMRELARRGWNVRTDVLTVGEAKEELLPLLMPGKGVSEA
ncbi:MAG TPA: energy-coupling factor transporter ATPase [Firmicutes bacterium]|nr:energy-coupling factor transporter ATPase [Bacillota bacterium]